jgi:methylamine---glutamate N-methyltransferase subunit B
MELDIRKIGVEEVNRRLRELETSSEEIVVTNASRDDLVLPGLRHAVKIRIEGSLGDYCIVANERAEVQVSGSVGVAAGEGVRGGSIVIRENAGESLGAFGYGGLITVYGSTGSRCAVALQGADIVVRGNVGSHAAMNMRSGTLVIGGSAGKDLGIGMTGGTIFMRGEADSVGDHLEMVRMKEPDRFRISLLMLKAGIKTSGADFRVYKVAK